MRIAILGYGVEGKSAERFFKRLGCRTPKCEIEMRDIKLQGADYLKNLENFDLIVRSPGIPYLRPEIQHVIRHAVRSDDRAKAKRTIVTSATKLFFEHKKGKVIGITGTKGKGTTATLLYRILKASGQDVYLAGNVGQPMLDILPRLDKNSLAILELSSFQLQDMDRSPGVAVVLDISPDHLNYHKSFKEYLSAKANLVRYQKSRDKVFYFADNAYAKLIAKKSRGKKIAVLADPNLILKIPGFHNLKNASMAARVAGALGAKKDIIKKTISKFKCLSHRLEFVRKVCGVKYYNDSASTNPAATVAALAAFSEPKILIAGGAGKGLSYKPLGQAIKKSKMRAVILFGRDKYKIKKSAGAAKAVILANDLKSAVAIAKKKAKAGDVVIFSPAAASFDMFKNYALRGKFFKKLVRAI